VRYSLFKFLIFFSISDNYFFLLSFMFKWKLFQGASSGWSAHRLRDKYEYKFDAMKAVKESQPVLFTGEVQVLSISNCMAHSLDDWSTLLN